MKLLGTLFGGMKGRSLAFRLVLISTLWIFAALAAGGFLLTGLFRDYVARNFDQRLETLLDGLVALSEVEGGEQLTLTRTAGEPRFDVPYSGWYWQISDSKEVVLRSRSLWDRDLKPLRGDGGAILRYDAEGPTDQELRVVERAIQLPGARGRFYYQVAGDKSEAQADIERFESTVGWALGALGAGLILAVLLQVRFGLSPLRRVGAALAEIRSGRAERLEGDFPLEVTPLAVELNQLLDHNAEVLRRARTHVGNLAHALKTPIAVLTNEADAAVAGPAAAAADAPFAETVRRQAGVMKRLVDHHMARARAAASAKVLGARTELKPVIEALCRTLARIHEDRAVAVTCECPEGISFRGERHDFEDLLGNLVDNGCKWARRQVFVQASLTGGRIRITVDDDGPGLKPEQRARVFQRGTRLDESTPGTGLGLSIVRDLAGLYGGSVELEDSPLGGLRAVLELPGF
jgi:signal transduction histidine kinase